MKKILEKGSRKGTIMSVYCIYGDEPYLRQEALKTLKQQLLDPATASWAYQCLKTPSLQELLEALGTVSFSLGGTPILEIQEFTLLSAAASDSEQAALSDLQALLTDYLAQPPEASTKHIVFHQSKVDRKVKFAKWFMGQAALQTQECKKLNFWETEAAAQWVVQRAKQEGIVIEPAAAEQLIFNYGVSFQPVMNEVQKLALYALNRAITLADVRTLSDHQDNVFEMLSLWLHQKDRSRAFQMLDEILLRQHPVQVFSVVQTFLDQVFKLRYWQRLGWSEKTIAETLQKHPFKVKKDIEAYRSVSYERLKGLKEKVLTLEWKAKTGQVQDRLALELLLGA